MKKIILLIMLTISLAVFAQQNQIISSKENYFKIGFQASSGLGFKNIDLIVFDEFNNDNEEVDSGEASISRGGCWNIGVTRECVFNKTCSFGIKLGYQSRHLRSILENTSVRFIRYIFQPTAKYSIGLNLQKDQIINLGVGYGFYTNGKLKLDARSVGLAGNLNNKIL